MKFIKLFLFVLGFSGFPIQYLKSQAPATKYDLAWKKVEAYSNKGLPKSALAEVKKIYTLAMTEKKDAQLIKAVVYMANLQSETRENNELFSIGELEKEIVKSKEPVVSILKSLLADMYWNYYQQNRWKLYNRTEISQLDTGENKKDIATWAIQDFHRKISELYGQSLKNKNLLQKTNLESYDAIIIKGNVRYLRPTLYDLLAHRALTYFQNDETAIKKPAYAFELAQASAFNPASDFAKTNFSTRDSLSLQYKALQIYQELIAFHLHDPKPDALIDADIQRIEFVKSKSTHPDKDRLYFSAINQLAHQFDTIPAAAQAWYLMAQYYSDNGDLYKPFGDTTHRFDKLKAKEICERIVLQKDSSEGKFNCYNLLIQLNSLSLQFNIEKVNIPDLPFRSLVLYKNFNTLHLRILKVDDQLKDQLLNQYDEKFWPAIFNASPVKTWEQRLPVTNDMQQHSTEIMIEPLPVGEYVFVASSDKDFNDKKTIIGARLFYVSGISYVNNSNDYFVVDRKNGQPLSKAMVQVWVQKYDYKKSSFTKEKGKTYRTDVNGFFRFERPEGKNNPSGNYAYLFEITHNTDRLFMNDYVYDYYYNNNTPPAETEVSNSIFLFTDRSIYRPGQTVYFKGIVITRNGREQAGKAGQVNNQYHTTLLLRDANYQDIDSMEVKTNEYGSFSGKFQLPQSGLNGQFSLYTKTDGGYAGIKVEEYKRPKFYVEYEPIKGTYKVNDTLKVTGMAKAYAGNTINGATVKYRVVRQPRFIYPWLFRRWWQPPTEEMEITHGEVATDKDGRFNIEFVAVPDLKIDKKFEPVFDYTLYADITDINGETRSGEKSVSVSYKSLILVSSIPSALQVDSLKKLFILTQNMNGEYEPSVVTVTISKLVEEKRLIRNRYWQRPDQFVMSKKEYINLFPYDEYDNETDFKSWEKGELVFSKTDSVTKNGEWSVVNGKYSPGLYMVEILTKDKNGEEVKDVKYMELFEENSPQLNHPDYLWTGIQQTTAEPGETASVELGTAADNLFIVHQIDKVKPNNSQQTPVTYSFLTLSNEKKTFTFPVTENDRGGYGVSWMFVKHNRIYQLNQTINVPWTNKDLTIEYASFRDKTLPGSEEKWKLKISGYKNEKVAAELLAGMYDASLDQFVPHNWYQPTVWPIYYSSRSWNGSQNFTLIQSNQKYFSDQQTKYIDKRYDYLFSIIPGYGDVVVTAYGVRREMRSNSTRFPQEELSEAKMDLIADSVGSFNNNKTDKDGNVIQDNNNNKQLENPSGDIKIRKNFNETAFFFPDLRTDSSGTIEFSFTMPEALTRWRFMALAHTKEAAFGSSSKEIVTQKELMVQPNAPRFLREGDKIELSAKIVNLSAKELTGTASLQLFDAGTNEPVDGQFQNVIPNQYFTVAAGQSEAIKYPLEIPYQYNKVLTWRIVARAGEYTDGEENALPVLTNRMLVTETMPLPMRGSGTKDFIFEKLLNSGNSASLQHYALTVEYTSNPVWYAVQALPYLMEYPYECAEQTWNRYYANSLASTIANSFPKIKAVFNEWLKASPDGGGLEGALQKNEELKTVLLEETPWVLQAKNEAGQKRNIALLFDMVKMSEQLNTSYEKLKQMQSLNGGFVWFTGGPDDRYITQYIVTGIGHLKKLKAYVNDQDNKLKAILSTAIPYLDRKIKEDYDKLIKNKTDLKKYSPGFTIIQYLYMRSFFPEYEIPKASQTAFSYFRSRTQQTWVAQSKYMQGMIALALNRTGDTKNPAAILKSLKETSITNEELGMYWKNQHNGWFWYEAPIETHALLIETFREVGKDTKTVDDLRTWLLKNKQTNNWKTTKATAEACYALLIQGTNWISTEPTVEIKLGDHLLISSEGGGNEPSEAGTGYFKKTIEGNKVTQQMGNISLTVASSKVPPSGGGGVSWGSVYWQYFEDLDKITTASTPLKLVKKLFIEKNTERGPVLTAVKDGDIIKVGDKIKVRIELRVDRDMEYVHMKDMRASAFEPVNVVSSYKWQGGLGYYESTKDASTNFFFNYLQKGTYVFEYPLFATHTGNFSNGITSIQCMYAPEFSSHSEGVRINIE